MRANDRVDTWVPSTTICGSCMASAPTVLKTSWSLLITGIRASIVQRAGSGQRGAHTHTPTAAQSSWHCGDEESLSETHQVRDVCTTSTFPALFGFRCSRGA